MPETPEEIAPGLWRWTARHPEWHPGDFGAEVASFAVESGPDTILIDPLLPTDPAPVNDLIDRITGERLAIVITIPYHVRSAEELRDRFRSSRGARRPGRTSARGGERNPEIWGHPAAAKRLRRRTGFREIDPGKPLPGGISAHRIGRPRRYETPLHLPSHRALVFGDALVETGGRLRVWSERRVDGRVERFYRERFNPTLKPLLELDFDRVLPTHGRPVMDRGQSALAAALRAKPWYHRP